MLLQKRDRRQLPEHALGIDITDGSIEIVNCIKRKDDTVLLDEVVRVALPTDSIVHGQIVKPDEVSAALRLACAQAHVHPGEHAVVTALPDAQVLTKSIALDPVRVYTYEDLDLLARHVYRSAATQHDPVRLQWQRAVDLHGSPILFLFAVRSSILRQWQRFFKKHGLRLIVVEMQSLALGRSLIAKRTRHRTAGIINLGYRTTTIAVFHNAELLYSHVFEGCDGEILRAVLMREKKMNAHEAEKIMFRSGLMLTHDTGISTVLRKPIHELLLSIKEVLITARLTPAVVTITGSDARIPGIRREAQRILGVPIVRGRLVLKKGRNTIDLTAVPLRQDEQLLYAGAVGLALRGVDAGTLSRGINFLD